MADLQSFHTAQNNIIMHLNNTTTAPSVARLSRHSSDKLLGVGGWVVQVTLENETTVKGGAKYTASSTLFVSHHSENLTTYTPVQAEAHSFGLEAAKRVRHYVYGIHRSVFPHASHIAIEILRRSVC